MIANFFQTWPAPANQIIGHYDTFLVVLSYLVAISASYIALDFAGRLREASEIDASILLWLLGGAIAMGAGIWSMHFVGMLSFSIPMLTLHYDIFWTALSLIVAIVASGFALFVLKNEQINLPHFMFGGIILGLAIASMHYTGMQAMAINMDIHYLPGLFFLSIGIAILASLAALWLAIKSNQVRYRNRFRLKVVSAAIMGLAICGMHYTGMAAAIFGPLCAQTNLKKAIDPTFLAVGIAAATFIILGIAFFASTYKEELIQQKVLKARQLGMAEVASSVLHNIGNSLNSINTSIELLHKRIQQSKLETLSPIIELLKENKNNIGNFLTKDPQGQHVLDLLSTVSGEYSKERSFFQEEVKSLEKNIQHVKNIIRMQQSLSHAAGMTQETSIVLILEDAIALNKITYKHMKMKIIQNFHPIKKVIIDKVKLLQIMTNLIKNSMEALQEGKSENKQLVLRIQENNETTFMIQVQDNGIGILPENCVKIFSYGFTTKSSGHGFALHTCALDAEEMGGQLFAESEGINLGATFTLILPYKPSNTRGENNAVR